MKFIKHIYTLILMVFGFTQNIITADNQALEDKSKLSQSNNSKQLAEEASNEFRNNQIARIKKKPMQDIINNQNTKLGLQNDLENAGVPNKVADNIVNNKNIDTKNLSKDQQESVRSTLSDRGIPAELSNKILTNNMNDHLSDDTQKALKAVYTDKGIKSEIAERMVNRGNVSDDDLQKAHAMRQKALQSDMSLDTYLDTFHDSNKNQTKPTPTKSGDSFLTKIKRWLHNNNFWHFQDIAQEPAVRQKHYKTINNNLNDISKGQIHSSSDNSNFHNNIEGNLQDHLGTSNPEETKKELQRRSNKSTHPDEYNKILKAYQKIHN